MQEPSMERNINQEVLKAILKAQVSRALSQTNIAEREGKIYAPSRPAATRNEGEAAVQPEDTIDDEHPKKLPSSTTNRPHVALQTRERADTLLGQFTSSSDIDNIVEAIQLYKAAASMCGSNDDEHAMCLDGLGQSLSHRYTRLGKIADVHEAIFAHRRAVSLTAEGQTERPARLTHLGNACLRRFERLGELPDIDEAISAQQEAASLSLTPERYDSEDRPSLLNDLGGLFLRRFERLHNMPDIEESIRIRTQAVELTPATHADLPRYLTNLAGSYILRYERSGSPVDVTKAISLMREAISSTPDDSDSRPRRLFNLGGALFRRFELSGNVSNINEAIELQKHAAALISDGHAEKPKCLNNLANSFFARFKHSNSCADIDESITALQRAVELTPDDHMDKARRLGNLGGSFLGRFDNLGNTSDIDEAISVLGQALAMTPDGHADKPGRLSNLGLAYFRQYKESNNVADIDESIRLRRHAVDLTPDGHALKHVYLTNVGNSLHGRFMRLGSIADIDESITAHQKAVQLIPEHHAVRPAYLSNLGKSHCARFEHLAQPPDIEKAISCQKEAVHLTPDGHAEKAGRLRYLAESLFLRFQRYHYPEDLDDALDAYRASAQSHSGPPALFFYCAKRWARCSLLKYGTPSLDAHATAVGLLPRMIWVGKAVSRRYEDILSIGDAVNAAAAAAIELQQFDLAMEWLEQGRSVVWGQILQLRAPMDDLRASGHDIFADELEHVSRELETAGTASDSGKLRSTLEDDAQKHRRLAARYEELLVDIRQIEGFERFLQPKKLSDLRSATTTGPVAVINVHKSRCDALILRDSTLPVLHVHLSTFTYEAAAKLRETIMKCLEESGVRERDARALRRRRNAATVQTRMQKILETLWTEVVKPILSALGYVEIRSPSNCLPHITWCATGPLAFLPIHAAGLYAAQDLPKVFQYVVSSYTTTLTALVEACKKPPQSSPRILAVSQPDTPGYTALRGTVTEVEAIKTCIADKLQCDWLNRDEATVEAVLKGMHECSWVHFACHGVQDPKDPMKSAFALYDGRLDLKTIMTVSFKAAEIAFLSACQTATGDEGRPEEAVHLAAGMLIAGYRTVFATMWSIGDRDAPVVAKEVYTHLLSNADPEGQRKEAYALHRAVERLRQEVGENAFMRWMPFIHFGS